MTGLPFFLLIGLWPLSCSPDTVRIGDVPFVSQHIEAAAPDVAVGDVDGDGHLDVVTGGEPITIYRGDGTGRLTPLPSVAAGPDPISFAIADLDGDGLPDLAAANHETDYLTVLLGDGRGGLRPSPQSPLRIDVAPHPHVVKAADLDGDGQMDLVVDHREGEGVLVLRGLGEGRFAVPGLLVEGGGDPYLGMAVGDLDGDGRLDMVTPNPRSVGVLLQTGGDELAFRRMEDVRAPQPFGVALADVDADGVLDLLVASGERAEGVALFVGDGAGGFVPAEDATFPMGRGGKTIAIGDFNGDAVPDAAVANYQERDLLIILSSAQGPTTVRVPAGEHPWGLAIGDLNEDGYDDLVVGDDGGSGTTVFLSQPR